MAGDDRLRSDRRVIAALAALFWKWTVPVRLWSNQKPSQRTEAEGPGGSRVVVVVVISFLFVLGTKGRMQPVVMAPKNHSTKH